MQEVINVFLKTFEGNSNIMINGKLLCKIIEEREAMESNWKNNLHKFTAENFELTTRIFALAFRIKIVVEERVEYLFNNLGKYENIRSKARKFHNPTR